MRYEIPPPLKKELFAKQTGSSDTIVEDVNACEKSQARAGKRTTRLRHCGNYGLFGYLNPCLLFLLSIRIYAIPNISL
jgi:hypothetical protein